MIFREGDEGSLKIDLTGAQIVILADSHNPSIVTHDWLFRNEIVQEEKPTNFIHNPAFSLWEGKTISLIVDSNKLQLRLKDVSHIEDLPNMAQNYVKQLPETPYNACGLNFQYSIEAKGNPLEAVFSLDRERFKNIFGEERQIGSIIRCPFNGFQLTLRLEPPSKEKIKADFNYHSPIDSTENLKRVVGRFQDCRDHSEKSLCDLLKEEI